MANMDDPRFQGYLRNIKAQTGLTPEDFVRRARSKGLMAPGVKVGQIVTWLNQEFGLGRGHAMALVVVLKAHSPARN